MWYYTYNGMYIQNFVHYYYMCHMDTGGKFLLGTKCILFKTRRTVLLQGLRICISICARMHQMDTGEVVGDSKNI